MPAPPGPPQDINILTRFHSQTCETTVVIYFETLFHSLKNVTLTLLGFGLLDVIRGYFRPVAKRKWRHGRKARKGFWKKVRIPETGEMFAKWIPGQAPVGGRWVNDGVKWLWTIDASLQKFNFIVMIHEVVDDFWTDMQSGIISAPESDCGNLPRLMMTGFGLEPISLGWVAKSMNAVVYSFLIPHTPFDATVGEGGYLAILTAKATNNSSLPLTGECQIRVYREGDDEEQFEYSGRYTKDPGETAEMVATLEFHGPGTVKWEWWKIGAEFNVHEWQINIFRIEDPP